MRLYQTTEGKTYPTFLDYLASEPCSVDMLNKEAVVNFLSLGMFYFEDSLFHHVKKIRSMQTYQLDAEQGFQKITTAGINPFQTQLIQQAEKQFLEFFSDRAEHLRNRRLTVDLTGGLDSRLVAVILHHLKIPFHAVFSLGSGDEAEAEIVRKVAAELGCSLEILRPSAIETAEQLEGLFQISDAHWDVLDMRSAVNTQRWRKNAGFDLVVTGMGGEFYRDFIWLQDFPFYQKRTADLERYIRWRISPIYFDASWYTKDFRSYHERCVDNFMKRLEVYTQATNSQTYDQVEYFAEITELTSVMTTASSHFLDSYSPLLEDELIRIGYNLKRSERFFAGFHRRVISSLNPAVAAIKTTDGGVTSSSAWQHVLRDIPVYIQSNGKKAVNKLLGTLRKKTPARTKEVSLDPEGLIGQRVSRSLALMKETGVFSSQAPATAQELPSKLWGRVLTMGMFLQQMK